MSNASAALEQLERFLTQTRAIHAAADAQDWDETARLGNERDQQLGEFPADLATRVDIAEAGRAQALIEECLRLDAQTRALAAERRESIRILLREP